MKSLFFLAAFLPVSLLSQTWDTLSAIPENLAFPVIVAVDDEIHVMGGGGPSGATSLHLRYTPATDLWDTLAPVPYLAQQPAGAVLNGKIHFFGGGFPNSGTPLNDHFIYDPDSNAWSAAADLLIPRVIMEGASINGKVYALTGQPEKTRMDEYRPDSNAWFPKNDLPDNHFWYSALVVHNNEMYRFGGGGFTVPQTFIHKYNSVSDSWTYLGALPDPLHAPAGTSLGNYIYIGGGSGATDDVWRFDPTNNSLQPVAPLPIGRSYHEFVTIDSCIYSLGGDHFAIPEMGLSMIRLCEPQVLSTEVRHLEKPVWAYPNPAAHTLWLEGKDPGASVLTVYDLAGRVKTVLAWTSETLEIDISEFESGLYFFVVDNSANGEKKAGRFVVE